MRVVFMGTPGFSATILENLMASHEVVGVFTRADAVRGRGKKLIPSPVKQIALRGGIPVFTPTTLRDPSFIDIWGHWAEGYIEFCYAKDIVAGMGNDSFAPSNPITGMQALKMVLVGLCGKNGNDYLGSHWLVNVNADALLCGLYDDLDDVDMNEPMTREHIAQMIWNALDS